VWLKPHNIGSILFGKRSIAPPSAAQIAPAEDTSSWKPLPYEYNVSSSVRFVAFPQPFHLFFIRPHKRIIFATFRLVKGSRGINTQSLGIGELAWGMLARTFSGARVQ
jgi:hypothetical protein